MSVKIVKIGNELKAVREDPMDISKIFKYNKLFNEFIPTEIMDKNGYDKELKEIRKELLWDRAIQNTESDIEKGQWILKYIKQAYPEDYKKLIEIVKKHIKDRVYLYNDEIKSILDKGYEKINKAYLIKEYAHKVKDSIDEAIGNYPYSLQDFFETMYKDLYNRVIEKEYKDLRNKLIFYTRPYTYIIDDFETAYISGDTETTVYEKNGIRLTAQYDYDIDVLSAFYDGTIESMLEAVYNAKTEKYDDEIENIYDYINMYGAMYSHMTKEFINDAKKIWDNPDEMIEFFYDENRVNPDFEFGEDIERDDEIEPEEQAFIEKYKDIIYQILDVYENDEYQYKDVMDYDIFYWHNIDLLENSLYYIDYAVKYYLDGDIQSDIQFILVRNRGYYNIDLVEVDDFDADYIIYGGNTEDINIAAINDEINSTFMILKYYKDGELVDSINILINPNDDEKEQIVDGFIENFDIDFGI
jgi:hypothetical protein